MEGLWRKTFWIMGRCPTINLSQNADVQWLIEYIYVIRTNKPCLVKHDDFAVLLSMLMGVNNFLWNDFQKAAKMHKNNDFNANIAFDSILTNLLITIPVTSKCGPRQNHFRRILIGYWLFIPSNRKTETRFFKLVSNKNHWQFL